jgi:TonB family protein
MESQAPLLPRPVARIFFRGCPQEIQTELLARVPIHEGDVLSDELLRRTVQVAKALDGRLEIRVDRGLGREAFLKLPPAIRAKVKPPACDDGVNVTIYDPASLPRRIRVEAGVQESMLIGKFVPVAPLETGIDERNSGPVRLSIVIGNDGSVIDARPAGGPEALVRPAVEAVKQWKYRPTLLNGFPVEVQTNVEVSFEEAP